MMSLPKKAPGNNAVVRPVVKSTNVHHAPVDDEPIEFSDVADVKYHRSFAFYGRAGTGKTTLIGTFPGAVLLIDVRDEGTDSVRDVKGLKVLQARTWQRLEKIYWDIVENPKKYAMFKTIAIDTITQVQTLAIISHLQSRGRSTDDAGKWGSMKQRDWGTVSSMMKEFISDWGNLPFNTVFAAQDREDRPRVEDEIENSETVKIVKDDNELPPIILDEEDQDGIMPSIGPSLSPATAKHLCAAVHVLGYTYVKDVNVAKSSGDKATRQTQYCVRVGPHPVFNTKVRKPKSVNVPKMLVDPTYDKIMAIINA